MSNEMVLVKTVNGMDIYVDVDGMFHTEGESGPVRSKTMTGLLSSARAKKRVRCVVVPCLRKPASPIATNIVRVSGRNLYLDNGAEVSWPDTAYFYDEECHKALRAIYEDYEVLADRQQEVLNKMEMCTVDNVMRELGL